LLKRFQSFVLRGKTAPGSYVDNQDYFSIKFGKAGDCAI
jgi:hypothetical protein